MNLALTANPGTDLQSVVSTVDAANTANPKAFRSSFGPRLPRDEDAAIRSSMARQASSSLPSAPETVNALRDSFRACYDAMLTRRPDGKGNVRLSLKVGEDGSVQSVSVSPTGNLDAELVTCVRQTAMNVRFEKPIGGPVMIAVPITFRPKDASPSSTPCQRAGLS